MSDTLVKQLPSSTAPGKMARRYLPPEQSGSKPAADGIDIQEVHERLGGQPPIAKGKPWFKFNVTP